MPDGGNDHAVLAPQRSDSDRDSPTSRPSSWDDRQKGDLMSSVRSKGFPFHRNAQVDQAMLAYVEWRKECGAVRRLYCQWSESAPADAGLTYCVYTAALDQEEAAARTYADVIEAAWKLLKRKAAPGR